tara:strand:+ start:577 stop:927 length:351 start_codon:yes stop_codon:yes gene_type:complete
MAVHSLTVKQIISRVRQVFPDAPEAYIMSLINDALVEAGTYSNKTMSAKINVVADQMFYNISDSATDSSSNTLELNKVYRVDFMDSDGDYIKIPRLLDGETLVSDIASESAIEQPD